MAKLVRAYEGPQCPRCDVALTDDQLTNGIVTCRACREPFEAVVFHPPTRPVPTAQTVIGAGPDGANACSTHAGNAAVTSCDRCGLFICSLCEMSVGKGTFCPACFDRVRAEGVLPEVVTKHRDYASMARLSIFGGIVIWFFSPLFAGLALYYSFRASKQRREEGRSRAGVVVFGIIAAAQFIGSLFVVGLMIMGLFRGGS